MIDDIPPHLRPSYDRAIEAIADAATARIRSEKSRNGDWDTRIEVTDELWDKIAALPTSSAELRVYAERVAAGECRWDEVEYQARPVPQEVAEIKNSGLYRWFSHPTPLREPEDEEAGPYEIKWE
ncbi:hypothetical protein [Rhodococcus sp. NPDC058514]|uniref:hypothetical protein n=1 Tax=unclassified Rhodococcus (in: high G+C Gram-positive bacteria) TaxID=192944 RepID=UPI003666B37F